MPRSGTKMGRIGAVLLNHKSHIRALEAKLGKRESEWGPDDAGVGAGATDLITVTISGHTGSAGPPSTYTYGVTEYDTTFSWDLVPVNPILRIASINYDPFPNDTVVLFSRLRQMIMTGEQPQVGTCS